MVAYADRIKETTTTTGTGTYSLAGAVTGFQTFEDGVGNGATCYYCAENGTDWEVGTGVLTTGSPDTLTRADILASSNGGAAVNWPVGTKTIFQTFPAVAAQTSTGALVLLDEQVVSAASTIDFTTNIDDTYDEYEIHYGDIVGSVDGAVLRLRTSTDGGSNYDSGASDYDRAFIGNASDSTGATGGGSTADTFVQASGGIGNAAGEHGTGRIMLFGLRNSSMYKLVHITSITVTTASAVQQRILIGMRVSTTVVNAVRLLADSGTVTGWARLYGVRKTVPTFPDRLTVVNLTSTTYTAAVAELVIADPTSNDITITLPTAVGRGGSIIEIKIKNLTNQVFIAGTGGQTVEGLDGSSSTSIEILDDRAALRYASDGTNWILI